MAEKPKNLRPIFTSLWLPKVYDLWVFFATFGNPKKLRRNIADWVPKNTQTIIDLATGTGENALYLKEIFPQATICASDLSQGMLSVAIQKSKEKNIIFSLQDATSTNYATESADLVCISFAIHDLLHAKRKEVMKEAFRILKPKGRFIIYEYHMPKNPLLKILPYIQFFLAENKEAWEIFTEPLEQELKKTGFAHTYKKIYYKGLAQIVVGEKKL